MPKYLDMHGLETLTGEIENTYLKKNQRGAAGGVASLNSSGKVPSSQLPDTGTSDYTDLTNKPQVNGVTLSGNKTSTNLGIHDIPSGGTTGQVLAKSSDSNYAVQWVNQQGGGGGTTDYADLDNKPQINGTTLSGNKTTANLGIHDVPSGGSAGQVLAKHSGTDHDVEWVTPADPTQVIRDGFLFNEERFLKPLEATETLAGTTWFFTVNGYFTATSVSCTFTSDSPYPGSIFPGVSGPFTHTLSIGTNRIEDTITSADGFSQTVHMYGTQYHPGTWDDQNHRVYTIPNEPTSYSPDKETFMETFLATAIRVSEYEIIYNALYCDIESGIEYLWDGTQFVDILKNGFDLKANKNNPEFSGHASFGYNSEATGYCAFASGSSAIASGNYSNSLGQGTKAVGSSSHVVGRYNIEDAFPLWVADTHYYVNDIVKVGRQNPIGGIYYVYRICTIENEDSSFDESKWAEYPESSRYVEIVGNGESNNSRSNARTLDWDGNERLKGNIYVNCNADGSGGTKLDPIVFATDSEIQDIIDDWEVSA